MLGGLIYKGHPDLALDLLAVGLDIGDGQGHRARLGGRSGGGLRPEDIPVVPGKAQIGNTPVVQLDMNVAVRSVNVLRSIISIKVKSFRVMVAHPSLIQLQPIAVAVVPSDIEGKVVGHRSNIAGIVPIT